MDDDFANMDVGSESKKTKIKIIVAVVIGIVVVAAVVGIVLYCVLNNTEETSGITYEATIDGQKITYNTVNLIKTNTEINSGTYKATSADQTVFLVVDGATLTLGPGVIVQKTGEKARNRRLVEEETKDDPPTPPGPGPAPPTPGGDDSYSFYGTNSAIVVLGKGSKAVINGITITTDAYGANAVVATNSGEVEIKNCTLRTSKDSSRGLHATYEGIIKASDIDIATVGVSCANLATDRGSGTVIAENVQLSTAGAGSPLIYSTGNIQVTGSVGNSTGAQIACIEGKNSITLNDCTFYGTGLGKNGDVDSAGVMIYQSMSGDADIGKGTFEAYNSNLEISESEKEKNVPFFFITNTGAVILLNGTNAIMKSEVFLNASSTDTWGEEGKNGGDVNMTIVNKKNGGKINADSLSSVIIYYDDNMKEEDFPSTGNVTLNKL